MATNLKYLKRAGFEYVYLCIMNIVSAGVLAQIGDRASADITLTNDGTLRVNIICIWTPKLQPVCSKHKYIETHRYVSS